MRLARVIPLLVGFVALLCIPADASAAAPRGPLFSRLLRIEASPTTRVETIVNRFASLGDPLGDETRSLAADRDVGALAAAFDAAGVDKAAFSTDAFRFTDPKGTLLQYRALAMGAGTTKDGPYLAVGFAMNDATSAIEQAKRLEDVLRSGRSEAARRSWSELFSIERVEARGRVVVAILSTKLPDLWLELERQPDTLLWWSQ